MIRALEHSLESSKPAKQYPTQSILAEVNEFCGWLYDYRRARSASFPALDMN
jgi:hypothetical protein